MKARIAVVSCPITSDPTRSALTRLSQAEGPRSGNDQVTEGETLENHNARVHSAAVHREFECDT